MTDADEALIARLNRECNRLTAELEQARGEAALWQQTYEERADIMDKRLATHDNHDKDFCAYCEMDEAKEKLRKLQEKE